MAAAQAGQAVLCQVLVGLRSVGLLAVLRLVLIPSEPANILLYGDLIKLTSGSAFACASSTNRRSPIDNSYFHTLPLDVHVTGRSFKVGGLSIARNGRAVCNGTKKNDPAEM